jgi:pimeloyl-ACP methyl ester carboxylesterase
VALAVRDRVTCVVLDAPPDEVGSGRGALTDEVPLDHYRQLARGGDMRMVRHLWSQHPFTRLASKDPAAKALLMTMIARYAGHDLLLGSQPPSPLGDLRTLGVPALVLNGDQDLESRRASGAELAQALGAARRTIVNAGHLANLDNPLAYGEALHEFASAAFQAG